MGVEFLKDYKAKDPDAKPYARGEFVCNVEALKVVSLQDGKRYVLVTSIVNAVKPKADNEALMSDEITMWFKPWDEKSMKKFSDNMFVSGLSSELDWSSDEALEASFSKLQNKLVYVKAYTFAPEDGGFVQMASLKSKSLINESNSAPSI